MRHPLKVYLLFAADWLTSSSRPWIIRATSRGIRYVVNTRRGARPVRTAGYGETSGCWHRKNRHLETDELEFGGACPVQGRGIIDGRDAYYRSRGTGWSLEIAPRGKSVDDDFVEWSYWSCRVYHFPDGGWLHADVTRANLDHAVTQYYKEKARSL